MDGNALTTRAKGGRMKKLTEKEESPCTCCGGIGHCSTDCSYKQIYDRLAEYEDMEEQGLLLKLPCKMGDKLWIIVTKRPRVYSPEFSFVKASKLTWNNLQQVLKGLKKTVFTSREAAERALEDA